MKKILLIEDSLSINDLLVYTLEKEKYYVEAELDGIKGLEKALRKHYDILIVDVMLPGIDGFSICQRIRKINQNIYIIIITALHDEKDIVKGLNLGADDYIVKPFSVEEVIARVKAATRRINAKEIVASAEGRELNINDKIVTLTNIEYQIFIELQKTKNSGISRKDLLKNVWGYEYDGHTRLVDVHINKLRKKLNGKYTIRTIRGVGYKLGDKYERK